MADTTCPIQLCQRIFGGKWTLVILWHLRDGIRRFGEIERAIGDVSPKALAENLRLLERSGLLSRVVHPTVPPRVDYALTPLGVTVLPILETIQRWGATNAEALSAALMPTAVPAAMP